VQLVIESAGAVRDVDLNIQVPDATVGDLLEALGHRADGHGAGVHVDGRFLRAYLALAEAGLHDGAVIRIDGDSTRDAVPPAGGLVLAVVGGVDAGRRFELRAKRTLIGRDRACDVTLSSPTVSARHAVLEIAEGGGVVIEDLGSSNGISVDGAGAPGRCEVVPGQIIAMGAVQLMLMLPRPERPAGLLGSRRTAGGNIAFNRPPRPVPAADARPVPLPAPPREEPAKQPFSWIMLLVPLLFAAVLVVATSNALFALFALLSPLMLVGNFYEGRHQGRRTSRREEARFAADLETFGSQLRLKRAEARARARVDLPDPSEVVYRASTPSVRLWERRPSDPDFLHLSAGLGTVAWQPPLASAFGELPAEVARVVAEHSSIEDVPVPVDLSDGGVVGIVGEREAALALSRALLCQAAVHHGPADVHVMVLTEPAATAAWDWTKWLPHTRDAAAGGAVRMLADQADQVEDLLNDRLEAARKKDRRFEDGQERRSGPVLLMVVDAVGLTEGRNSPVRAALRGEAGPVAGIVLAPSADRLPAICTTVVEVRDPQGLADVTQPQLGRRVEAMLVGGVTAESARSCALALARFDDPEAANAGSSLPSRVDLAALFDEDVFDAEAVAGMWRDSGQDPGLAAPIGVSGEGVFTLDLLDAGPHGLVGGTTGSGKSELLRSLVAALAVRTRPDHLNFMLIDYKGGSAFDVCAQLPHTVGLVTDLDAELGERALRCLEAELRFRERLLREAGADDLRAYLRLPAAAQNPLPRLLVVIDEFATMAAELPEFMEALVGVAQRGRSLGVHLLLATQRPSGAVKDNIRANTNLRIALRVQDDNDSTDVIGTSDAARIGRDQPGRAFVRLGPSEVEPIQTALVTGVSRQDGGRIDVAPFRFGMRSRPADPATVSGEHGPSDLERIVAAARAAFESAGMRAPRRPWPEPLPAELPLDAVADPGAVKAGMALVALADDPDAQAQYPVGWDLREGNLLLYGVGGSGTTTTLASIAISLAGGATPDDLHLYVLDFGAGELAPLAGLPHTAAVVGATEEERQRRLVRVLRAELDRRRDIGAACRDEPLVVLLIDGLSALRAQYAEPALQWVQDELTRVVSEGPALRILTAITADRAGAVPAALSATVPQKWVFRLADPYELALFGSGLRAPATSQPGRCVVAGTGQLIHVGRPAPSLAEAVEHIAATTSEPVRPPPPLGTLPRSVCPEETIEALRADGEPWLLPVGVAERTLAPAVLPVYPAEHVLIAGPARSGRSSLLLAIARMLAAAVPRVDLTVVAPRPSPLRRADVDARVVTDARELPEVLAALTAPGTRHAVLIDDAETLDDPAGAIDALLKRLLPDVHLVVAGRADQLRTAYGHWTQIVRRSGTGVLLRPDVDFDGDLLAVRLPRQAPVAVTVARGWMVHSGEAEFVQAVTVR
jgi:DNA segregation ATPase FtsK/SpoIIIE, S-DNA-T family